MRAVLVAFALMAGPAVAGLTAVLAPAGQPASPGAEVLFSGTLTNTSTTDRLFLNDVSASFAAGPQTDTALSSNDFFANVPGILLPGETYEGPLFRISLSTTSPARNYSGTITFSGGADMTATDILASAALTVLATPVDQWRHQTFGDEAGAELAGDAADWDHDGLPNLIEYALALDALASDGQMHPTATLLEDHLILSYVPVATDVLYAIESSTDLLNWGTSDVEPVAIQNPAPPQRLTFRFKNAVTPPGRAFLRLRITRSNPAP